MSKIKVQEPIVHTPSIERWGVPTSYVDQKIRALGLIPLYPNGVHAVYWYTNLDGVVKLLPDLLLKSALFKQDIFTCINYAFKVWLECATRYDLNTWVPVIGRIPNYESRHAWNLIMVGDETGIHDFLYFEPNDGWSMGMELEEAYQAFPIGEVGYIVEFIFY